MKLIIFLNIDKNKWNKIYNRLKNKKTFKTVTLVKQTPYWCLFYFI